MMYYIIIVLSFKCAGVLTTPMQWKQSKTNHSRVIISIYLINIYKLLRLCTYELWVLTNCNCQLLLLKHCNENRVLLCYVMMLYSFVEAKVFAFCSFNLIRPYLGKYYLLLKTMRKSAFCQCKKKVFLYLPWTLYNHNLSQSALCTQSEVIHLTISIINVLCFSLCSSRVKVVMKYYYEYRCRRKATDRQSKITY